MWARKGKGKGFTLVEILIVVVILGILAAIVIPQFSNASQTAKASSLASTLQTVRSQLELFQVQHSGAYPPPMVDGADGALPTWQAMTDAHSIAAGADFSDGVDAADLDFDGTGKGPYMQKFPANPFANGSNTAADHWFYDETSGRIVANVSALTDNQITELELDDTDDYAKTDPFGS